jgi:hypothetical protein
VRHPDGRSGIDPPLRPFSLDALARRDDVDIREESWRSCRRPSVCRCRTARFWMRHMAASVFPHAVRRAWAILATASAEERAHSVGGCAPLSVEDLRQINQITSGSAIISLD